MGCSMGVFMFTATVVLCLCAAWQHLLFHAPGPDAFSLCFSLPYFLHAANLAQFTTGDLLNSLSSMREGAEMY